MSSFHSSSYNDEDFENSATNYALSQNYDHDIDYNSATSSSNALNSYDEETEEVTETDFKKKKQVNPKDSNEPTKPVSAYATFFGDTQIAIKSQNPDASFPEIAKIVASMWNALDQEHKNVYKKKAETAKRDYVKQMAEYRANAATTDSTSPYTSPSQGTTSKQQPIVSRPAVFTIATTSHNTDKNNDNQKVQMMSPTSTSPTVINVSQSPNSSIISDEGSYQKCIREGCINRAVVNPDWEDEYCSNECAVRHCRNVFNNWVKTNQMASAQS